MAVPWNAVGKVFALLVFILAVVLIVVGKLTLLTGGLIALLAVAVLLL